MSVVVTPRAAMSVTPFPPLVKGILSPVERFSEVLFGVLMALTITGAVDLATGGELDSRAAFLSALGCNVAWGIVDAVMYILASLLERGRRVVLARAVRSSTEEADGRRIVVDALPEGLGALLTEPEVDAIRRRVAGWGDAPERASIEWRDLIGAAGVFLLVVVSTLPVALPFVLVTNVKVAMRISRGLSLMMIFLCSYAVGVYAGLRPVRLGLTMLGIGVVLVGLLKALGG